MAIALMGICCYEYVNESEHQVYRDKWHFIRVIANTEKKKAFKLLSA